MPVVHDIGSGLLAPHPLLPAEPDAATSLRQGASLVTASGDKLLGGPQAGLLLGDAELVRRLLRHPLARALRVDKLTLAALEATLTGPPPPVARTLAADAASLVHRAERTVATLAAHRLSATVVDAEAAVGGGGAPGRHAARRRGGAAGDSALPRCAGASRCAAARSPPWSAGWSAAALLLDLRSVDPADDDRLVAAVLRSRQREH